MHCLLDGLALCWPSLCEAYFLHFLGNTWLRVTFKWIMVEQVERAEREGKENWTWKLLDLFHNMLPTGMGQLLHLLTF